MRHVKLPVALIAAGCVFAVSAAPAMAEGFKASAAGTTNGGKNETNLVFKFGEEEAKEVLPKIQCTKYTSTGTVVEGAQPSIIDVVTPKKCTSGGKGVKFEAPLELEYTNPAVIEAGSEKQVKILNAVPIKVSALKCLVTIGGSQGFPKEEKKAAAATFANEVFFGKGKKFEEAFPTGETRLAIHNALKFVEWETEPIKEGHGLCSLFEESGERGEITGSIVDELKGGNLGTA